MREMSNGMFGSFCFVCKHLCQLHACILHIFPSQNVQAAYLVPAGRLRYRQAERGPTGNRRGVFARGVRHVQSPFMRGSGSQRRPMITGAATVSIGQRESPSHGEGGAAYTMNSIPFMTERRS
jgi:hypothetical protein